MKKWFIRGSFYIIGLIIISLGITLTINADLGAGAWDALNVGLTEKIGLTIGNWVIIIGGMLIVSNAFIAKEKPDLLAVITIVIVGKMVDFWMMIALADMEIIGWFYQGFILLLGICVIAIGVALYLQPEFSLNPIDNFMVALQKRFGLSLTVSKTLTESFALIIALLMGGPIGIGTIIILLFIGPFIQFFNPKAERVMNRLISS
ncbi:YitT family protein [Halobacillus sp. Marseille-Q1614]|uniref:YczE/YyaS/YitT family protein n=1 Tax=Halobacillus sp. Marseille-Q1614 TaxID=2709134 RepID=UPI001570D8AD|nr:YitT family protein [Halobacillus sp. Marseille-Q1614]